MYLSLGLSSGLQLGLDWFVLGVGSGLVLSPQPLTAVDVFSIETQRIRTEAPALG